MGPGSRFWLCPRSVVFFAFFEVRSLTSEFYLDFRIQGWSNPFAVTLVIGLLLFHRQRLPTHPLCFTPPPSFRGRSPPVASLGAAPATGVRCRSLPNLCIPQSSDLHRPNRVIPPTKIPMAAKLLKLIKPQMQEFKSFPRVFLGKTPGTCYLNMPSFFGFLWA